MEPSRLPDNLCPVCLNAVGDDFIAINDVPVFCNVLWDSRNGALDAPKGTIRLFFCSNCGHVFNGEFDPNRVEYTSRYENSLQYSPLFRNYLDDLAERLVQRYDLHQKKIIEIGSGRGDFLRLLSEKGGNRCTGFEPGYDRRRGLKHPPGVQIDVVRDYYSDKYSDYPADFIACRQVLEHIVDPRLFMGSIRRSIGKNESVVVFFEVPNAMFTLEKCGIWDLIYEHCGYFTMPSLDRLFHVTGFSRINIAESFGGQYLCMDARPLPGGPPSKMPHSRLSISEVAGFVHGFADMYFRTVSYWQNALCKMRQQDIRPVIWGAGSKGVTFLNVMTSDGVIDYVIDINPHKQGRYVPGTGQKVISPRELASIRPQIVIAMNPLYTVEIERMIADSLPKQKDNISVLSVDRIDDENNRFML